jgi:hypothetical protein
MVVNKKSLIIISCIVILAGVCIFALINRKPKNLTYSFINATPIYKNIDLVNTKLPITITPNKNFFEISKAFRMEKDTVINIQAVSS